MVVEDTTRVKDYLTKSKDKSIGYVINPYVGCPCKCLYCYASYMASFSKHKEQWGDFIDVKYTRKKINTFKIKDKKVMISTVTDPYNVYEEKYGITRMIMEQLVECEAYITIVTKSNLVLRDIDLLKRMKHVGVVISMSFLDEVLRKEIEPCAPSIADRISTLKELKNNGIKTILFISPIIPQITNFYDIIHDTEDFVDEYWFDKLNLRSSFKTRMFDYIDSKYPDLKILYENIYNKKDNQYFDMISKEIDEYCNKKNITYINFIAGT